MLKANADEKMKNGAKQTVPKIEERLQRISNSFYNDGLNRAKMRDLSGAVTALRKSIQMNKRHVPARNLLGLLYFETGEVVLALKQWVISKNIQSENNPAERYLAMIQENPHVLKTLDTGIKKYNQALAYIEQNSADLAIIQLKKVVSMNPKFIKAYLLLALLYTKERQTDNAKRQLLKVMAIDKSNVLGQTYLNQLTEGKKEEKIVSLQEERAIARRKNQQQIKVNQSIQQIALVAFGFILGIGLLYFLVLPSQIRGEKDKINQLENELLALSKEKTELASSLATKEKDLVASYDKIRELSEEYQLEGQTQKSREQLLSAYLDYFKEDFNAAMLKLDQVKTLKSDDQLVALTSQQLSQLIYPKVGLVAYRAGTSAYNRNDFETAINQLLLVVNHDTKEYYSDDAYYYLARSYQKSGQSDRAIKFFKELLKNYPNTDKKNYTKRQLNFLQSQ